MGLNPNNRPERKLSKIYAKNDKSNYFIELGCEPVLGQKCDVKTFDTLPPARK